MTGQDGNELGCSGCWFNDHTAVKLIYLQNPPPGREGDLLPVALQNRAKAGSELF
jgi:hypothetical protein